MTGKPQKTMDVTFHRTGIPWLDAGIVGLYRILTGMPSYLEPACHKDEIAACAQHVKIDLSVDGTLTLKGTKDHLQAVLELAYEELTDCYFNVSSAKQRADRKTWNFYFDSAENKFEPFPKSRAAGAALLLFDKASRPTGRQEKWGLDGDSGKPRPGILPDGMQEHQPALDQLVADFGLKPGPPAGVLIDGPNKVQPKVKIRVGTKEAPTDFLSGMSAGGITAAKNTSFPLFGGSRSFANNTDDEPRIGWQFDFVGKFVPAVSFFYMQSDDLYLFFPQSNDLSRMADVSEELVAMCQVQPNFFRNFEMQLGGYFSERSEVTFSFLYSVFRHFSGYRDTPPEKISDADDDEVMVLGPEDEEEAPIVISSERVFESLYRGAPVNFAVVAARKMGNVWMGRDFQTFTDILYVARLLDLMTQTVSQNNGPQRQRCPPKRFMVALIDFSSKKNKTLLRNKVCDGILSKQSVLSLLEQHAFHKFSQWNQGDSLMISVLLDFAQLYEPEICEDHGMNKEQFEEMAKSAKWLGEKIADAVAGFGRDDERSESVGRSKGVFFRLRRARTLHDFQDEIIRLQMRYKVDVPANALDPDRFNPDTFSQYKGFCVIAALSRFEYRLRSSKQTASAD